MPFESVSAEEFAAAVAAGPTTELFKSRYSRLRPQAYAGWGGTDYQIHRGPLNLSGTFVAPGFFTLVIGDLTVDGLVDLHNPYDKGFDEGGLFIVMGDVTCNAFANEYGKCSVIDGHLKVRDILLNSFEDSALFVTGDLATRFFFGSDIWAEVGGGATMDYGEGYCLPIGYDNAAAQAVYPNHGEAESLELLAGGEAERADHRHLLKLLRDGRSVFKAG